MRGVDTMKRPDELEGITTCHKNNCGHLYVTINYNDDKQPIEIFLRAGKSGQPCRSFLEVYGKWITDSLISKRDLGRMAKHCLGISCHGTVGDGEPCFTIISKVLTELKT